MRKIRDELLKDVDIEFTGKSGDSHTLTACLNRIYLRVKEEGLTRETTEAISDDVRIFSDKFHVSPMSSVLIALILEQSSSYRGVDEADLADFIGCTKIEFIDYRECLRELARQGIVCRDTRDKGFAITKAACESIRKNTEFVPQKRTGLTNEELFCLIRVEVRAMRDNDVDEKVYQENVEELITDNLHLEFCRLVEKNVMESRLTPTEKRMFYYLCHRYVNHGDTEFDIDNLICASVSDAMPSRLRREFINERTAMQKAGLVTFAIIGGFVNEEMATLSDTVKQTYFQEMDICLKAEKKHRNLIPSASITAKRLFYNESEDDQIRQLEKLLEGDNFSEVVRRMEKEGMRKGFNVILYGGPGTGKTACIYELARRTGRDIFFIDMSKLRNKCM